MTIQEKLTQLGYQVEIGEGVLIKANNEIVAGASFTKPEQIEEFLEEFFNNL